MGSLMAGWQTDRSDARQALKRATSSMTSKEVQRFWRTKQSTLDRHCRYIRTLQNTEIEDLEKRSADNSGSTSESASPPSSPSAGSLPSSSDDLGGRQDSGWWTKSSWAFLNDPLKETTSNRYVSQFDVAERYGKSSLVQRRNSMPAL